MENVNGADYVHDLELLCRLAKGLICLTEMMEKHPTRYPLAMEVYLHIVQDIDKELGDIKRAILALEGEVLFEKSSFVYSPSYEI